MIGSFAFFFGGILQPNVRPPLWAGHSLWTYAFLSWVTAFASNRNSSAS
jgi:hypothetical protein